MALPGSSGVEATIFKPGLQMRYAGHHAVDAEVVEFEVFDGYFTGDFSQGVEGLGGLAIWHKDIGCAREIARTLIF
ncbi:hypothetical protein BRC78_04315 [Halobacteriales archaeon QH_8_68_33]|nr:MAG: hypothetical protein BRC78_04315 [Halobacteriales archaeon QH_8_68_33]